MTIAKRPGRPPLDPRSPLPSTEVSVSLAATDYAQVKQLAAQDRASVQDVIRRQLRRLIISRNARGKLT